jgi:hypothetical protein
MRSRFTAAELASRTMFARNVSKSGLITGRVSADIQPIGARFIAGAGRYYPRPAVKRDHRAGTG